MSTELNKAGSGHGRGAWSGQFAFILACAASAVGLGNIWRFPYLAAQYGGGIFLLFYIILVVTLGFTIMLSEVSLGRATKTSAIRAFGEAAHPRWHGVGFFVTLVPFIIVPYYCVIGGWILKYICAYLWNYQPGVEGCDPAVAGYFGAFIGHTWQPLVFGSLFILFCIFFILRGLKSGIETSNKIMMPLLLVIALVISAYSVCQEGAFEGLKYYVIPNFKHLCDPETGRFSFVLFCKMLIAAMGQMFYSLSLAMGITITYGSYMRKEDGVEKSVRRIEIVDTLVAFLAGLMIIPACFAFPAAGKTGAEMMQSSGPGLMFNVLPQVFNQMTFTQVTAISFFVLVLFAAATSAISLLETCVSSVRDVTGLKRVPATLLVLVYTLVVAAPSALCYGNTALGGNVALGMPFLDFSDFLSNNVMMPLAALFTCLYIGWVLGPKFIYNEVTQHGNPFKAYGFYRIMLRYVAPVLIFIIFVTYTLSGLGVFKI